MDLNVLAIGSDGFAPALQTADHLEESGAAVSLGLRFIVLEGETDTAVRDAGGRRTDRCVRLPGNDGSSWPEQYMAVKRWVRLSLGDEALDGFNLKLLYDAFSNDNESDMKEMLRLHVRGSAGPDQDGVYATDGNTVLREDLTRRWTDQGNDVGPLVSALDHLAQRPHLGKLTQTDEHVSALSIRPSEYILHAYPDFPLIPQDWNAVDWILLTAANRNAEDVLERCLLIESAVNRRWREQCAAAALLIHWPDPWSLRPLSGSAWEQMAFARFARMLRRVRERSPSFSGAMLHFSDPLPDDASPGRPAQASDFLELLAHWQAARPAEWREMSPGRSVILGIARAVVERPWQRPRSGAPVRVVAAMERGSAWQIGPDAVTVTVGGWSASPRLWSPEIAGDASRLNVRTVLFAGQPILDALEKRGARIFLRADPSAAGKLRLSDDGLLPPPSARIPVPYQNFLAVLVIVTVEAVLPVAGPGR